MPDTLFPKTIVQTCIVYLIRSSTRFVAWINRKALIGDLRLVYAAQTEEAALAALAEFEKKWGERYPMVAQSWRSNWERIRPLFAFGHEVRKILYTTNAIESLNFTLRKVTKARGHFSNDETALKLVYLGIRNMEKKWTPQPCPAGPSIFRPESRDSRDVARPAATDTRSSIVPSSRASLA